MLLIPSLGVERELTYVYLYFDGPPLCFDLPNGSYSFDTTDAFVTFLTQLAEAPEVQQGLQSFRVLCAHSDQR
jgi:hypothetical protein